MLQAIEAALLTGDPSAIKLVLELAGKTKIVELNDEQVSVISEILRRYKCGVFNI